MLFEGAIYSIVSVEFSIPETERVYFANPAGVESTLSRVTGDNFSSVLGVLGVDGSANFSLINPAGIIFGNNASLDVEGSFTATSASSVQFSNSESFSAIDPEIPTSLLSIAPSAYLFEQLPIGEIISRSTTPDLVNGRSLGLRVGDDQNLTLLGGDVTLDGGGWERCKIVGV